MGHVVSEVWSNTLDKWIFLDPQFSIHAKHQGRFPQTVAYDGRQGAPPLEEAPCPSQALTGCTTRSG